MCCCVTPVVDQPREGPLDFATRLNGIGFHVDRANAWASERFRLFPNLDSVSVSFGVAFGLQVDVALTWNRKPQSRKEPDVKLEQCPLAKLAIPQDVIDAANKLGVDAENLVKLCVEHTVEAARGWLTYLAGKLPSTK